MEISEKRIFHSSSPYLQTKLVIVMGHKRWNGRYTLGNKHFFDKNWLRGIFDCVFVARSQVRATKCDLLAKIWGVTRKHICHNFRDVDHDEVESRVWHLVSRLLGIETFLNFLRVSVSVSKILVSKKSLGIGLENIWSRKKVSVSVSKIFGLEKSLGIGLENFGLKQVSVTTSKNLVSKKS